MGTIEQDAANRFSVSPNPVNTISMSDLEVYLMSSKPRISILYCPRCNWLLRSAWLAQELLTTFSDDLSEVALKPAEKGGTFEITLDNTVIWDRNQDGGFPEAKVLKQRVRDCVAPDRTLGHIDR